MSEPSEPTIRPGHALVWCRTCGEWEGCEVFSEDEASADDRLKGHVPSKHAYVWDENVEGQRMHVFRNMVTGHRLVQPPAGEAWLNSRWFDGNPHVK